MRTQNQVDDYKILVYKQDQASWVAKIPAIPGCYAIMDTPHQALDELTLVFEMIAEEYKERNQELPNDVDIEQYYA